jgi:enoyl-[acyl-carrier-protein] reductase (NADH)
MAIPKYPETSLALKGRKGLIVGIANDQSIAWGCAKAFRALGADLAVTYLNDKAKKYVDPLAKELEAEIFLPSRRASARSARECFRTHRDQVESAGLSGSFDCFFPERGTAGPRY